MDSIRIESQTNFLYFLSNKQEKQPSDIHFTMTGKKDNTQTSGVH